MRVSVVVASVGRSEEISQLLAALERQSLAPSCIVLSVVNESDIPAPLPPGVLTVFGTPGLPAQRNRGLELALPQSDAVVFYDDDFLPACDSLENISRFFETHPEMAGATGHVIKDGINSLGLSYEESLALVSAYEAQPKPRQVNEDYLFAYGCNMAFRCTAIGNKRFDENLPKYAWQEDMDYAAQISSEGKVIRTNAFAGVHRGVKTSRSNGQDLGFSQIVNPVYLTLKGTMTPRKAWKTMWRNFVANHVKALRPESHVDRIGRVKGNWSAIFHLLSGKVDPSAIPSARAAMKRAEMHERPDHLGLDAKNGQPGEKSNAIPTAIG
jgi:GT2 family glycosyltransferase